MQNYYAEIVQTLSGVETLGTLHFSKFEKILWLLQLLSVVVCAFVVLCSTSVQIELVSSAWFYFLLESTKEEENNQPWKQSNVKWWFLKGVICIFSFKTFLRNLSIFFFENLEWHKWRGLAICVIMTQCVRKWISNSPPLANIIIN